MNPEPLMRHSRLAALPIAVLLSCFDAPPLAQDRPTRDQRPTTSVGNGVIRGQVVDGVSGAPVARATVRVFAPEVRDRSPSVVTNDEGRFEIRELPAGKFTVSATKAPYVGGTYGQTRVNGPGRPIELRAKEVIENIVIKMTPGGVIVGRVLTDNGEPAVNVEVRAMRYTYGPNGRSLEAHGIGRSTDDLGQFRLYGLEAGQYYVTARVESSYLYNPVGFGDSGPITTYFPSAAEPASAQRVAVAAGKETGPVPITLVSTKLSDVRGRAMMSDGQPFAASMVEVTVRETNGWSSRPSSRTQADGRFEIKDLPPGIYDIDILPMNAAADDVGVEIARATLTVLGDDIENVLLVGGPTAIARGKVIADDGSPVPSRAIRIAAVVPPGSGRTAYTPWASLNNDQTFELRGLYGARYIRPNIEPALSTGTSWTLRTVQQNGLDTTDKPIEFQPGAVIEDLEVVLTQKATELTGTITVDTGAVPEDAWVVLFTADETLWREAFRFVRGMRPDREGIYRFDRIAAHDDYLLVAAVGLEPGQWMDPDFLRSVRDRALRLSIGLGEKKVQHIRMATAQ